MIIAKLEAPMTTQDINQEQVTSQQEAGRLKEKSPSPANVLEFLRRSNILNLEIPLRTLFEQVETLQPAPSTGWGIVGDSGHVILVWKSE